MHVLKRYFSIVFTLSLLLGGFNAFAAGKKRKLKDVTTGLGVPLLKKKKLSAVDVFLNRLESSPKSKKALTTEIKKQLEEMVKIKDMRAQYGLGLKYLWGNFIKQDIKKGLTLL